MKIVSDNRFDFVNELRSEADLSGIPLFSEPVTDDVSELIEETYIRGILSECLALEIDELHVDVEPVWESEPVVKAIEIKLTARCNGNTTSFRQSFAAGRWVRSAQRTALRLREEGTLSEGQVAHRLLIGLNRSESTGLTIPPLAPPPIFDQSLEEFGIRRLGNGQLDPHRPVLINQRMSADAVRQCQEANTTETGGVVLGKILRLRDPLPGTQTRVVTILSTTVEDPRHVGAPMSFTFSPEGLAEAAQFAELRGLGETVQTVFHTHGWSNACGNCNQNAACPLAECNPSLQDYQLLESLFSSKATLMPIAGRLLGESTRKPVLQVHGWRGGEMCPIRWQEYCE